MCTQENCFKVYFSMICQYVLALYAYLQIYISQII